MWSHLPDVGCFPCLLGGLELKTRWEVQRSCSPPGRRRTQSVTQLWLPRVFSESWVLSQSMPRLCMSLGVPKEVLEPPYGKAVLFDPLALTFTGTMGKAVAGWPAPIKAH